MPAKKVNYKQAIWEAIKEPLRLLVLAVLPVVIAYLAELPYQWAVVAVVVLRLVDKLMHEIGKATKNASLVAGITRF